MEAAGTLCRASVDACDLPESCDGSSGECPDDLIAPFGTRCGEPPDECFDSRRCDGAEVTCPENADPLGPDERCRDRPWNFCGPFDGICILTCGDGKKDALEACDPAAGSSTSHRCRNNCVVEYCGTLNVVPDGRDPFEQCDPNPMLDGAACSADCRFICGSHEDCVTKAENFGTKCIRPLCDVASSQCETNPGCWDDPCDFPLPALGQERGVDYEDARCGLARPLGGLACGGSQFEKQMGKIREQVAKVPALCEGGKAKKAGRVVHPRHAGHRRRELSR
jgi:hypothetical protein